MDAPPTPLGLRLAFASTTTGEQHSVPATLDVPVDSPRALLVLAHGAGAGFQHRTMAALSANLVANKIATLRFNFPFMEQGRPRVDDVATSVAALVAALALATQNAPGVPLLLGGHSFGGRMASHAAAQGSAPQVSGLVFFAFPLHAANKPAVARAAHFPKIQQPMLFLSGTRDALADAALLRGEVSGLGARAQLHWLQDADHSYATRKRERLGQPDVFVEIGQAVAGWLDGIT